MARPFPHINQLDAPTADGHPDENARMNCVAASLAVALTSVTGRSYEPDQLHDAVYGQGYQGGQAAKSYVLYCEKQGVSLSPVTGTPQALLAGLHDAARRRVPCLVTIPSHWSDPPVDRMHPGSSHVVCIYDEAPGVLIAMNPWGGFDQIEPDSWWADRLCYGEIWQVAAVPAQGGQAMVDGFEQLGAGFQAYVSQHNITGKVVQGETYDASVLPSDECFAAFDTGLVLHYKAGGGVDDSNGGNLVAKFYQDIKSLQQQVVTLKAQNATLQQQQQAAGISGSVEALAVIQHIAAALKALP